MRKSKLSEAIVWMAPALGVSPITDRERTVAAVNKFRSLVYGLYDNLKLFDDYTQCIKVQEFCQNCTGGKPMTYRGITLPSDMEGVVTAWESLEPVVLRSRWREAFVGKLPSNTPEVDLIALPGDYPTELELNKLCKLKVYASSKADTGKIVTVVGKDVSGIEIRLEFTLEGDAQVVVNQNICEIVSVTLPIDLCGKVDLYQEDGRQLSSYCPGITVPTFRRYRLTSTCSTNCILVQGTRTYQPIFDDEDIVEVGDQIAIENAARHFRYEDSLESREIRKSESERVKMELRIQNLLDRERGRSYQDGSPAYQPQIHRNRRRQLPGRRRSHR